MKPPLSLSRLALCTLMACLPLPVMAGESDGHAPGLHIALQGAESVPGGCRLGFTAENRTGQDIDAAVFETVVFGEEGGVLLLTLLDFKALPAGVPQTRRFDIPGPACAALGRVLIRGAQSCLVGGVESAACVTLTLSHRTELELLE